KWDIEVALFQHVKRTRGSELGQAVVGEDQVQPRFQLGGECRLGIDPLPGNGEAGAPQVLGNQQGVIGPVLQDQDTQCHKTYVPIQSEKVRVLDRQEKNVAPSSQD